MENPNDPSNVVRAFGRDLEDLPARPLGRFFVSYPMIAPGGPWTDLQPVFLGLVPVRIEAHPDKDALEYVALGECFEPVPMNEPVPLYQIEPNPFFNPDMMIGKENPKYLFARVPEPIANAISQS